VLPETVEYFVIYHLSIKKIFAGSHHAAAITKEGELYTWGSNKNGCLGRKADLGGTSYTAIPGLDLFVFVFVCFSLSA
jgi:alpha-tubulin suppressor-like RCC1 family protein